jgi:hypothetical protein
MRGAHVAPAVGWGGDEVDSWEAKGQSLWKSSDEEEDGEWNSYDENDYPLDNDDEGDSDEGDDAQEDLQEITPHISASSSSVVAEAASPSSRLSQHFCSSFTVPKGDPPDSPSTMFHADYSDSGVSELPSCFTSQSVGSTESPKHSISDASRPFSSSPRSTADPAPVWTDSEEGEGDSSEYSSSSDEDRAPAFNVNELVAHLRELGYAVPESDQPIDLKELLGKMDEYFQDLFKKQADQRKIVEVEHETETIVQEVHQWGKHKTLWMMLNDLSIPNDKCLLKPDAGFEQITRQYRKVLLRIHPDKNAHKGWREYVKATEQFKLLSAAFHSHKKKVTV